MLRLRHFRVKLFGGHYLPFACYYSPEKVFSKQHWKPDIKLESRVDHRSKGREPKQKQFRIYPCFQQAPTRIYIACHQYIPFETRFRIDDQLHLEFEIRDKQWITELYFDNHDSY